MWGRGQLQRCKHLATSIPSSSAVVGVVHPPRVTACRSPKSVYTHYSSCSSSSSISVPVAERIGYRSARRYTSLAASVPLLRHRKEGGVSSSNSRRTSSNNSDGIGVLSSSSSGSPNLSGDRHGSKGATRGYNAFSVGGLPYGGLRVDSSDGLIRRLELHMPENMNSLDPKVLKQIQRHLTSWESNFMVKLVVLQGLEGSFCSGLDIASLYADPDRAAAARKRLCEVASYLAYYEKPVISVMEGSTIGAGYALCQGRYQVATQDGMFFVCEPSFGLGLEGGLSYTLPRLKGLGGEALEAVGRCLALTGLTLTGPDLVYAGLASNFIAERTGIDDCLSLGNQGTQQGSIQAMRRAIQLCSELSNNQDGLAAEDVDLEPDYLKDQMPVYMDQSAFELPHMLEVILDDIVKVFDSNCDSVEQVVENLKKIEEDWARQAVRRMEKASPLALKVVFQQMKLGKKLSFNEALKMEFRVGNALQRSEGFASTVAEIIQHNNTPVPAPPAPSSATPSPPPPPPPSSSPEPPTSWWSKSLRDVTDADVANILEAKGDYELPNLDFPIIVQEGIPIHITATSTSSPGEPLHEDTGSLPTSTTSTSSSESGSSGSSGSLTSSSSSSAGAVGAGAPPKERRFKQGGMEKIDITRDSHPDRDEESFVDVDKVVKDVWQ